MLAAIFLTDESTPDRGNLWVWPGSHRGHQQLFRDRGVDVLKAVSGHAIMLDPPAWFGPGEPLIAGRGDVLLAHYLLGHNIGGNTSADTRRILYYRPRRRRPPRPMGRHVPRSARRVSVATRRRADRAIRDTSTPPAVCLTTATRPGLGMPA